ncbi:MAG: hypothetical protein QME92_09540 [Bacillota bacterium]|nr:hypothetical protein [Bacillota bacterium]
MLQVSVVPFGSPLRDRASMDERVSHYLGQLRTIPGYEFTVMPPDAFPCGEGREGGVTLILALSGGIEASVLEFLARSDEPALILAHPADNAVAAAIEILAFLNTTGRTGRIVQAFGNWCDSLASLLALFAARAAMKGARLGVIGTRDVEVMAPWRLSQQVARVWGPRLVYVDLKDLVDAVKSADDAEAREAAEEFRKNAVSVVEPDVTVLTGVGRIYIGLRNLVAKHRLDAVTVKCFDLLPLLRNTGCYALARLNEEGVPAACEADVLSALGMLFLRRLTGQPSFMANPSVIDLDRGRIILAHCTVPRTMARAYTVRSHFESGIGAAIHGEIPPGAVTVARLGGRQLAEVFAASGRLVECGARDDMCRTQLTVDLHGPMDAHALLRKPLGNHHLVVLGDWARTIHDFVYLFTA